MKRERFRMQLSVCASVVFVLASFLASFANAQPANPLPNTTTPLGPGAQQALNGSFAILGTPFGVVKIEIPLRIPMDPGDVQPIEVLGDEGRIFYPATRDVLATLNTMPRPLGAAPGEPRIGGGRLLRRVGDLVRQATTDPDEPQVVSREVMFLFRGDQPLRVRLSIADAAGRSDFVLTPTAPLVPEDYSASLNRWWNAFTSAMKRQIDAGDYPAIVESYLVAFLSGRLDLPLPADFVVDSSADDPSMASTLKLIAGTEKIRGAIFRRAAIGSPDPITAADLPLPAEPRWALTSRPGPEEGSTVEPLAERVPPECFYIRYGSFENYLWFNDLSSEYGGDIGRMLALRGSDEGATRRIEDQLNLKMTAMSRMLGSSVIDDQAIVGSDLFLSEGASIGVMFRAKNTFLLQTSLNADRNSLANSNAGVKLTNEKILNRNISFLSTVDNRVRSFMIVEGDAIFVTNSRTLAKRFIEVSASGASLAKTPEFRLARQLLPIDRGDTIFAYFSPAMMRGLVSPTYLIELRRRLFASADMSLVRIARLAAAAEGEPLTEPQDLIEAGYLPSQFLTRSDGSGLITIGDEVIDSLRGRAGTLLPIADVEVEKITASEAQWYGRIASYYETQWPQLDPIFLGVRRSDVPENPAIQRLELRAEVAPFLPEKYGNISKQLGPPTRVKIDFAPDDIVAGQAHVVSDQLGGTIPPHHLFAAVKDTVPPQPGELDGILKTYQALRELPGYLGAWPQPGLLDRLPLGLGRGQAVGPGMTRLIGGVYRFQGNGFSIVSMQSDVLMASLPYLVASEAETSAQVRLKVGNLLGSQLEGWVNEQLFKQSEIKSRAGAEFLATLTQQLNVPPEDAKSTAALLLGGQLQDPLGGTYSLATVTPDRAGMVGRQTVWVSDAWLKGSGGEGVVRGLDASASVPPGYVSPILSWFRGGKAELTQYEDRLVVDAVVDVERKRIQPARQIRGATK